VFNVSGYEAVPLSILGRWTRRPCLPLPGPLLQAAELGARWARRDAGRGALDGPHVRFGFTLETARAAHVLGFRPRYRVGLSRAGDGAMRLEAVPA
jgi:hypothetical protein